MGMVAVEVLAPVEVVYTVTGTLLVVVTVEVTTVAAVQALQVV